MALAMVTGIAAMLICSVTASVCGGFGAESVGLKQQSPTAQAEQLNACNMRPHCMGSSLVGQAAFIWQVKAAKASNWMTLLCCQ